MEGGSNIQRNENSLSSSREPDKNTGCDIGLCDPSRPLHRFLALIFMCLLGFGSYFCYDSPGALQDNFKSDLNISAKEFMLLYSIYSWPNVILCFIGGFLIDSVFGIRLGTNIYMGLTLIGQCIFATGGLYDAFWLMMLGRFIFGIGAESLAVAQNSYAVLWFKGKELNMVFGLQLSFARVGSTVNFMVMGSIYDWVHKTYQGYQCIGVVLFLATLTCVMSFFCSVILGILDKRAERILRRNDTSSGEVVRLKDIKDFPISFWLVTIICVAYYVAIFPFIALGKVFFIEKFHMAPEDANKVNSIVYLISAFVSPLFGLMIDKTGRNLFWVFLSINVTVVAHMLLAFTQINPYYAMVTMGLSYSVLASALWPLVALVIPEHQLGTAYGICQSVQNLGLAVISILAGMIVDHGGYYWLELFFIASLYVALLATVAIMLFDICGTGILNMSPGQREEHQRSTLAAQVLEREQLLNTVASGVSANDLLHQSDFHIRNRYLSRIGAPLPSNYNVNMKGLAYRALR